MSRSDTSILVFGIYLVGIGSLLLLAPNTLLALANIPTTREVWIRLAGMLLLILAFYYIQAVRLRIREFYRWTLYTRLSAIFILVAFVQGGLIGPVVYLFWLGDLAGAVWTGLALWSENKLDSKERLR